MASFNVEDFLPLIRLRSLKPAEVLARYNSIRKFCWFDDLAEDCFYEKGKFK